MGTVVVKLTENVLTVGSNKPVLTVNVSLEATGKGASKLTGSPQDAVITVQSRASAKDPPTTLATFEAPIAETGKKPVFNLNASPFKPTLSEKDTDNSVVFTFDTNTFSQPKDKPLTFLIRLPAEPPALSFKGKGAPAEIQVGSFQLGASLTIGGATETDAFLDIATVPLRHADVVDDFDSKKNLCIGATLAHPTNLRVQEQDFPPNKTLKLPINSDALEILFHPTVEERFNKDKPNSFDLAKLTTNLTTIFSPVFSNLKVEVVPAADPRLADWKQSRRTLFSTKVKDTANQLEDEGHLIPFFQFWFFAPETAGTGELGSAETLAAPKFFFNAATRQKRIQKAAELPFGSGASFLAEYRNASADGRMILLANVVAHEVGHALGLLHVQKVESTGYTPGASFALMAQQFTSLTQFAPAVSLKKLHPVHVKVLKFHYT